MEEKRKSALQKKRGGFVSPGDMMSPEPEINDAEAPKQLQLLEEETEKKPFFRKPWLWAVIATIILLVGIICAVVILNRQQPEKKDELSIALPTALPYQTNGFVLTEVQARLINRNIVSPSGSRADYWDMIFNVADDSADFNLIEQLNPTVTLNAVPLAELRTKELTIALYFKQDVALEKSIQGLVRLSGWASGSVELPLEFTMLPEAGIIFVGLDDLTPEDASWAEGNYHFIVELEGQLVLEREITVMQSTE